MSNLKSKGKKRVELNSVVVNALADRYGLSKMFVRQSIAGERVSPTATTLQKEYKTLIQELKTVLNK
jgi:hypothetical protein